MENFTIAWDDQFALGITMIDDQHKNLIQLVNRLFQFCCNEVEFNPEIFQSHLLDLIGYARFHFKMEAKLLEVIQYPDLMEHMREHESFLNVMLGQAREFQKGQEEAPWLFAKFIREWTIAHISYQDRRYARHLQEIRKHGQSCRAMDIRESELFHAQG